MEQEGVIMDKIEVNNQAELDAIPIDYRGLIVVKFGTTRRPAIVSKQYCYPVEAWGNSSVEARENSSVVARENSSVVARENSSVEAWGNSSVVARGNVQVLDRKRGGKIITNANSRVVTDPTNIDEYISSIGDIEHSASTVRLFKAVRKYKDRYFSDYNPYFEYQLGEYAVANGLTVDTDIDCGQGIHMAHKAWCVDFGKTWDNLAILEVEANKDDIIVPRFGCGKVRAKTVKVIREVPLEECGLIGKMYLKRHPHE